MVVLMILSGFGWQKQSQLLLAPSTVVGLKKQSQFWKEQNSVKSVLTTVYGDLYCWWRQENKAKQSQFASL